MRERERIVHGLMELKHVFFRRLLLLFPRSLFKGFTAGKRHSNGETLTLDRIRERVSCGGASLSRIPSVNGRGYFLPPANPLHQHRWPWMNSKQLFSHHRKSLSSSSSSEQNCFPELDSPPPPSIQLSDQAKNGGSKRIKYNPAKQLTWNFDMCSKDGDVIRALDLFDSISKEDELALRERHYNVVLYLCSSAATGSIRRTKSGNMRSKLAANISPQVSVSEEEEDAVLVPKDVMDLALRRGFEIWEHMQERNVSPNEATYTSLARLAMVKGDGDLAFEVVKKMAEARISPRLRSYGPALFTYCRNREPEKAFEVEAHMLAAGIEPEEEELRALLKVSVESGLEDKVYTVLHKLRNAVRELSPNSVGVIEQWFKSDVAAASVVKQNQGGFPSPEVVRAAVESNGGGWHGLGWLGHGKWKVERANIDKQGVCLCCGEQLCTIDIDPLETEKFSDSLFELACQRETSAQFKNFQSWLNKRPPFYAVVDAANVGLYNQNFTGGFRFQQLKAIVAELQASSPDNRLPLIILHNKRTRDLEASLKSRKLIQEWLNAHSFFPTPTGSNDDWYWLYAAVKCKCLLVTNDEMRDHLFQILGNDFFPKWKERHQVKFTFENGKAVLHMPPPYSIVIQESASGAWHVPRAGGDDITTPRDWVCVTRKTQNET